MRKLTASFYISLDGVVDAPREWHFPMVDDAMMSDVAAALEESDTILLGRAAYQEWADFRPHQPASNPMAGYSTQLRSWSWAVSGRGRPQLPRARRFEGLSARSPEPDLPALE